MVRLVLIGLVAGVFSSLFGVGGGIVIVPLLIMAAGFAAKEASAVSLGAIAITALAGVVLYALRDKVDVEYAALVGLPGDGRSAGGRDAAAPPLGRSLHARVRVAPRRPRRLAARR